MEVFQLTLMKFSEWLKLREFHQGTGAMGSSLPMPGQWRDKLEAMKLKKRTKQRSPMFNIDRGQSYQGTRKDDGNG